MPGPPPAVAATRVAVRAALADLPERAALAAEPAEAPSEAPAASHSDPHSDPRSGPLVLVACSGGPDSLALAAATAFEAPRAGLRAGAVVVDHGLQSGSAQVAQRAATACRDLLLEPVRVTRVDVTARGAGPEAAAREARLAALERVADELGARAVLLGHTRDDQAEQVLLGLARGSGARSLAGMPARRGRLLRPFVASGLDRATTHAACAQQGLTPWHDPHNDDPRYARVRARALVDRLEADLGPGVAAALARSADLLRADDDALTGYARAELAALPVAGPWPVATLLRPPAAVRGRLVRLLCARAGAGRLSRTHVEAIEALLAAADRGPASLPGGWTVNRSADRLHLAAPGRVE